jgi:NAD(P)-dependent dehydrogenase (short-subunit alcohol dehydrogenase family)
MYSYSAHPGYTCYPSLQNRSVFITGGATGIGAALVEAFAAQGAKVAFVDIDEQGANALCDELEAKGYTRPWFERCDVSDITALQQSIADAQQARGGISVLINNAANDQRFDTRNITAADWHRGLAINLHPAFFAAQAVQPMMAALGGGSIINISSINVQFGPPRLAKKKKTKHKI